MCFLSRLFCCNNCNRCNNCNNCNGYNRNCGRSRCRDDVRMSYVDARGDEDCRRDEQYNNCDQHVHEHRGCGCD